MPDALELRHPSPSTPDDVPSVVTLSPTEHWRIEGASRLFLEIALRRSGLSVGRFARDVLLRDRRTVQRWRAGSAPIPRPVRARLAELLGFIHPNG